MRRCCTITASITFHIFSFPNLKWWSSARFQFIFSIMTYKIRN
uniref:Uncharacterized protein n=1 Tax=Anguilla anguilla TaxID=7936 RepID=A0A0E9PXG5_ANGAN